MPWWCKTWQHSGYNNTRANQNLSKRPRRTQWSSWSQRGNPNSFTLTIPWHLANPVQISSGIIVRQHHTDQRLMVLQKEQCAEWGASAVLLQSGLNENWWAVSMECYTFLRNVTDLLSDGKTPYERRFGQPFKGPVIPFGSLVEYHPKTAKDQSRIHQFGKKVLPGLFLGYALYAGNLEGWRTDRRPWGVGNDGRIGNLLEKTQCERGDISQTRRIYFPIAGGRIKTHGVDQELRTSTLARHRPIRGEGHVDFLGESEGSLPQLHDSLPDAGEAIHDFWSVSGSFVYRHHVEPRVKLYSPREESFPIPLKYIDVTRTTHTNLDVKQEKRIDDYWNIDGSRNLSDPWTGFTQFTLLDEKAPDGYTWSGGRLTSKQLTSRPDHLWHNSGNQWESTPSWRRSKNGLTKRFILKTLENWEESISSTRRIRNSKKPSRTRVRSWKHRSLLLCPVKLWRIVGMVDLTKFGRNLRVFWKLIKSTRMRMGNSIPANHEDHIEGKERSPNAPKFEDRSQEETDWQEQAAREAAWTLAKNVLKSKEHQRATFFSPSENRCLPASTLKPEEREFVVDSGASMHMISKKDLSKAEMDTLTKSCSPTIVITANGEVQSHEEAIVYVKELDIFLTMKVLENTPAVLSLGKLCDENGYSYEWINGQKPRLIKNGIRIPCTRVILRSRNGCKNSGKFWWMMKFHYREALTPVLLMKPL